MDWLRYSNQGATRNQPLAPNLVDALSFLPDLGVTMNVISGGQDATGPNRTGSTRHDHGNAVDADFYMGDRRLDPANAQDRGILSQIVSQGRANGLTGFGEGADYMGAGRMHLGYGNESVWGAGGKGANAPDWLRAAFDGTAQGQQPQATMSTRGTPPMAHQQAPQGILGALGIQKRDENATGQTALPFTQRDNFRDVMGNLATGFNSMRLNPDQNLGAQVQGRQQGRRDAQQANRTMEWLLSQPGGARFEGLDPRQAMQIYQTEQNAQRAAASNPNVQSSSMLPDGSGSVLTMRDGSLSVVTSGGENLSGQDAMDFVSAANAQNVTNQQDINRARRSGTLGADIDLGGEAARVGAEGVDIAEMARSNLEDAAKIRSNLSNINSAISSIDRGADAGMIYNNLPRIDEASAALQNSMDRMGLDVVGSVTFGALSAGELNLAMQTAVPRNLPTAELRTWLVGRRDAQEKARAGLLEASEYFANGGNMAGWVEKVQGMSGSAPNSEAAASSGVDPALLEFMSPEERALFQ